MRIDQVLSGKAPAKSPRIGHNRGELSDLAVLVKQCQVIMAKPIVTHDDANQCEDHRHLLSDAVKRADEARKAEKAPHAAAVKAVDEAWQPAIRSAESLIGHLKLIGDVWVRNETARKHKEAEQALAAEAAADTAAGESAAPPAEVVGGEKVMLGTIGRRRSATPPIQLATIFDLKAAAQFLAEQEHPDLVAVVQKVADRAAKARTSMPGIHIS